MNKKLVIYITTSNNTDDTLPKAIATKLLNCAVGPEQVEGEIAIISAHKPLDTIQEEIVRLLETSGASLCCLGFSNEINNNITESIRRNLCNSVFGQPINYALVLENSGFNPEKTAIYRSSGRFIYTMYFVEYGESGINESLDAAMKFGIPM